MVLRLIIKHALEASFSTKYDFLYHLPTVRNQTFTSKIIRAGLRDRGIVPYNPEIVFEKIGAQEIIDAIPILQIWDGMVMSRMFQAHQQPSPCRHHLMRTKLAGTSKK
jgi:hypothetical protein